MAKKRHFEDLDCWQKARLLTNAVYYLTSKSSFSKDYRLRDQLQTAAGSAMHHIAAGWDAGMDSESIRFLKLARRSCSEVQSELYLAMDRKYVTADELSHAYELAEAVKQAVGSLLYDLRENDQDLSIEAHPNKAAENADTGSSALVKSDQAFTEPAEDAGPALKKDKRLQSMGDEINYYRPNDYDPDTSEPDGSETEH